MELKEIHKKMSAVMAEISHIGKTRKNVSQNYNFRGIDDVYNAVHEAMVKHEVFCLPKVLDMKREEKPSKAGGILITTILTMQFDFVTTDGSSVSAVTIGEGMDSGDKSGNKAMSGAQKYAFFQVFCIPTEEQKDSEYENPEPVAPKQAAKATKTGVESKSTPKADTLLSLDELIAKMTTSENVFELKARWTKYEKDRMALSNEDRVRVIMAKDSRKTELDNIEKAKGEAL